MPSDLEEANKLFLEYASLGKILFLDKMLDMGARLDARGQFNRNALHAAAANGMTEMVKHLVKRTVDQGAEDEFGDIPLMLAIREKEEEAAAVLIPKNANFANPQSGATPLMTAAAKGLAPTVRALLDNGAAPDAVDVGGKTAAIRAAENDHAEVLAALLEAGADIFRQDKSGCDAVTAACEAKAQNALEAMRTYIKEHHAEIAAAEAQKMSRGTAGDIAVRKPLAFRARRESSL